MKKRKRMLGYLLGLVGCVLFSAGTAFATGSDLTGDGGDGDAQGVVAETDGGLMTGYDDVSEYILQLGGLLKTCEEGYEPAPKKMLNDGLSANAKSAKQAIYEGLLNKSAAIDVEQYHITVAELKTIYPEIANENPELLYVTGGYSWTHDGTYVYTVKPGYSSKYSSDDVATLVAKCQEIVGTMPATWTKEQKLLYMHDYMVTHCEYDLTYSKYDAYNCLVEGSAVCQGYSEAFVLLGKYSGIDVKLVTSYGQDHAWNMVELDGNYYFIDATWDDPANNWYPAYCGHANFLRNRDGMIGTGHGEATDWTTTGLGNVYGYGTTSSKYETYFWSDVITAIPCIDNYYAYAKKTDRSHVFLKYFNGAEQTINMPESVKWYVWQSTNSFSTNSFVSFTSHGGDFYFSTPNKIYKMTKEGVIDSENPFTLSEQEQASGYIYGIMDADDGIQYWIATKAYDDTTFTPGMYAIAPVVQLFSLKGANMNLGNELSMNFYVEKSKIADPTGCYADFTMTYANNRETVRRIPFEKWSDYDDKLYKIVFYGIAAKEMNDKIKVQIFNADGEAISGIWNDSVVDYVLRAFESQSDKVKRAMVDMLNYGAAAQESLNYNTANLANKDLPAAWAAYASSAVAGTNQQVKEANYQGCNLNLGTNLCLNMYFTNIDSSMYAILEYRDHNDKAHTVRVNGNKFIPHNETMTNIRVQVLAMAEVNNAVTCTVYDKNNNKVGCGTDSIGGYIARQTTVNELYDAIMKFSDSAYKVFHNNK